MPWTLNVYSARAFCFLGFFPKTNFLFLGSRLALQRGRRSTGSLCGERGHEEETVNILTGGRGDDTVKGGGSEHFAGRGVAWGGVDHAWRLTDGFGG